MNKLLASLFVVITTLICMFAFSQQATSDSSCEHKTLNTSYVHRSPYDVYHKVVDKQVIIEIPAFRFVQDSSHERNIDEALIDKLIEKKLREAALKIDDRKEPNDDLPVARNVQEIRTKTVLDNNNGNYRQRALDILKNRCASCHTGPDANDGVVIFKDKREFNESVDKLALLDSAEEGRMPPVAKRDKSKKLTQEELKILRKGLRKIN